MCNFLLIALKTYMNQEEYFCKNKSKTHSSDSPTHYINSLWISRPKDTKIHV